MQTDITPAKSAYPSVAPRTGPVAAVLVGLGLVALIVVATGFGREARATADQAEAVAIEQETQSFCTNLGLKSDTDLYSRCADGLNAVRRRQQELFAAQAAGVL